MEVYQVTEAFRRFMLIHRILVQQMMQDLPIHHGQMPLLDYLMVHDGSTQKEIADALGVTTASVAVSTKRLQHAGLLTKSADDHNLRCNRLSLTEFGCEMTQECRRRMIALDQKLFEGFTLEELGQITVLIQRLMENAKKSIGMKPDVEPSFFQQSNGGNEICIRK